MYVLLPLEIFAEFNCFSGQNFLFLMWLEFCSFSWKIPGSSAYHAVKAKIEVLPSAPSIAEIWPEKKLKPVNSICHVVLYYSGFIPNLSDFWQDCAHWCENMYNNPNFSYTNDYPRVYCIFLLCCVFNIFCLKYTCILFYIPK